MTQTTDEQTLHWMQTVSGKKFYPLAPDPEAIDVGDIAYALARVCRFGGHCRPFYSVGEHSLRVCRAIAEQGEGSTLEQMCGLLHDASEAYVGDMVWPLKQARELEAYKQIEKRIEAAIAVKFGLPEKMPAIVKRFDLVLLSTEKRDLMSEHDGVERQASALEAASAKDKLGAWHSDSFEPLIERITPAEDFTEIGLRFIQMFNELERRMRKCTP